jgi:hypothetical protein
MHTLENGSFITLDNKINEFYLGGAYSGVKEALINEYEGSDIVEQ